MASKKSEKLNETEGDAFIAAVVPILCHQIRLSQSDWEQPLGGHERELGRRIERTDQIRDYDHRHHSHEELLRMHYLEGKRHPDDVYLSIDKWDETD